jgi:glutamate synthase (NADPH) small chain
VEFVWLAAPEAFLAKSGKAKKKAGSEAVGAVRAYRMRLGIADTTGRQLPEKIEESSFDLPCDLAIQALGFDPEDVPTMFGAPELAVTRWGTLKVNHRTMMTAIDGVFAAGDIVRGASLVVWAIRDGKDAAAAIHKYLAAKAAPASVAAE